MALLDFGSTLNYCTVFGISRLRIWQVGGCFMALSSAASGYIHWSHVFRDESLNLGAFRSFRFQDLPSTLW